MQKRKKTAKAVKKMYRTDDPYRDFDRYEDQRQKELDKLPECCECGNPILTEECYEINGELLCPECLNDNHRKLVEDYVE